MDYSRERGQLAIFRARIDSLEDEFKAAIKGGKVADERIKALQDGLNNISKNRLERIQEIDKRFGADIAEQEKQIQFAQDLVLKRKEDKQALMNYLTELDIPVRSIEDFRDFDWDSLRRIAENVHKPKDLCGQSEKADRLHELLQDTKHTLNCLNEVITSTGLVKDRFVSTLDTLKEQSDSWVATRISQTGRLSKLHIDNERLDVLLRQCMSANEHMTDYITKNVQAKCQSFLSSDSPQEILSGLKKFKARQERVIHILRHKDEQLGRETNKLEVAKDQTHDQLKFYLNLIANRRTLTLTRLIGSEASSNLPPSSV